MSERQPIQSEGGRVSERKFVKLTANLPAGIDADLRDMAERRSITVTQVLRSAIAHEKLFMDEVDKGSKILIEREGEVRELVFIP